MSDKIKALRASLLKSIQQNRALADLLEKKADKATEEEHAKLATGIIEAKSIKRQIEDFSFLEDTEKELTDPAAERKALPARRDAPGHIPLSHWGAVKNFHRDTMRESNEAGYRFGMWYSALFGQGDDPFVQKARQFCHDNGIKLISESGLELKVMKESVNTTGGFLVPGEFDSDLILLREQYGVFRRNARLVPMTRDTKSMGRQTAGLTAYFVGEATAPTESELALDMVTLTARKLMTLTRVSSELNEDIVIALGDHIAGEIAYAFANKEDECGFNGTGGSTHGGIVGLRQRITDVYGTSAGVGQVLSASPGTYATITLANFNSVVGALPQYADGRAKWFVSKFFWATVMQRLAVAAGGVTAAEVVDGVRVPRFLGYDVEIAQVMPKTTAVSQVCALLGDLKLSSLFGDRRQTMLSMTEHRYFDTDEIGIKGSERFDINNKDVGDATNAGPVVALTTAAS